jgi:hypothetical protein
MMDKKFRLPEKNKIKFAFQKKTPIKLVFFLYLKVNFLFCSILEFVDSNNAMFRNPKLNLSH